MATPQITTRVDEARKVAWQEVARAHGYDVSGLIRALMDGAVDGTVNIPPKAPEGVCHLHDDARDCEQPRFNFPWSELCQVCKFRFRG